jgi:hypothetical protein
MPEKRALVKRTYKLPVKLLTTIAMLLLLAIMFGKPIYSATHPESQESWVKVYRTVQPSDGKGANNDEAFGRQLDSLTSFYSTLVSALLTTLGLVGAMAFVTIRMVSSNAAEDTAREVALRVLKDSKEFHKEVSRLVEQRFEETDEAIEDINVQLEQMSEALQSLSTQKPPEPTPAASVVSPPAPAGTPTVAATDAPPPNENPPVVE